MLENIQESSESILLCVNVDFKPNSECDEITLSHKMMLKAILKAPGHLKFPLDIIRPVPMQHVTCHCLLRWRDVASGIWCLTQDVITS